MIDFPYDPRAYVWIPPRLAAKLRRTCPTLGAISTVAAVASLIATPIMAYDLPSGRSVTNGLSLMGSMFCTVGLLMSGIALLFAPTWVEVGYHAAGRGYILRQRPAYMSAGPIIGGTFGAIPALFVFFLFYLTQLTWSDPPPDGQYTITPGVVVYVLLPVAAFVLSCVNAAIGWPVLRPSPQTIYRYSQ